MPAHVCCTADDGATSTVMTCKSYQTVEAEPIRHRSKRDSLSPCMGHCHCHGQCHCHKNVTSSAHSRFRCQYHWQPLRPPGPGSSPSADWISRSATCRSDASLWQLLQLKLCETSCRLAVWKHWLEGRYPAAHGQASTGYMTLGAESQRLQG